VSANLVPGRSPTVPADVTAVRLRLGDILRLGLVGLRTRKARAALSALGISIGIATMIVVTGIPASSQQDLLQRLAALGTNTLKVEPEPHPDSPVELPRDATAMVRRIAPVTGVSAVANTHRNVQRSDRSDAKDSVEINVLAARNDLLAPINATMNSGRFLDAATDRFPTVVLGHQAAGWLGFARIIPDRPPPQVTLNHRHFTVIGILDPVRLAPDLDQAVLVGWAAAQRYLQFDGHPTVIYLTAREDALEDVRAVLPATVHPQLPDLIRVSRPSDALAAKRATEAAFSSLLLGLAGVAVLVGGIGVANTMIISVLERRREIGLRRALGSSRRQIRGQFLTEAVLLSGLGGLLGTLWGVLATIGYAMHQGWTPVIPTAAVTAGIGGALVVGILAGVYPSVRASRLTPTEALATS
jgi:putative ABC transport system permease protein